MERTRKYERVKVDAQPEADLITGLIVSKKFCEQILSLDLDISKLLRGTHYRTLYGWILTYYRKHGERMFEGIQEKLEEECDNLDEAQVLIIENFLRNLNSDYVKNEDRFRDERIGHEVEKTKEYLIRRRNSIEADRIRAGKVEEKNPYVYVGPIQLSGAIDHQQTLDGEEIFTMEIREVKWLVRNIIPKGLTLFAGKSKLGKSSFVSNLALSMAQGKKTCGNLEVREGKVLYINLEDPADLIKRRMRDIEPDPQLERLKENLTVEFQWRKLDQGGLEKIEQWITDQGKKPLLIIIDTLEGVRTRPKGGQKGYFYSDDYHTLLPLKNLTKRYKDVSIMVVGHTTKSQHEDVFMEMGESMGMQAPTDTLVAWSRPKGNPKLRTLSVRGKQVQDEHYTFKLEEGSQYRQRFWGKAEDYQRTEKEEMVIVILIEENRPLAPHDIHEIEPGLFPSLNAATQKLYSMEKAGLIRKLGRGQYVHGDYGLEKTRDSLKK